VIRTCILNLRQQGSIDDGRAQLFLDTYDELERTYRNSMSSAAAAAAATEKTMEAVQTALARKRRQAALRLSSRQKIVDDLAASNQPLDVAIPALFDFDERMPGVSDVNRRHRAILGKLHGMMTDALETFDRDLLGRVRNPARLSNMVRELFGQETGDAAARQLADAWSRASEYARQRFNMAGGHIGRLEGWGLPQTHDGVKVKTAGFEAWRDYILPRLDLDRMVDHDTGQPFTRRQLLAMLEDTYNGIITDGWDARALGARGVAALANRRAEHRFLIFRDGDGWLDYQARFGIADTRGAPDAIFDSMMGHLDGMSRDIGAMEILGPSPTDTVRWLSDMLDKAAATDAIGEGRILTKESRVAVAKNQMETMWGLFTGELNRPVNAQLARSFSALRSIQTAAKLGGAAITAITDLGFQFTTRKFNGLPVAKAVGDYISYMLPSVRTGDKAVAVRAGLLAEEAAGRMGALWRYHEEFNTPALTQRIASGVLRVSGLSRWTQVGRWVFGMEYMGALADNAGRAFADMDPVLRQRLEFYGIDADGWEAIRSTPLFEQNGTTLLRPDELAGRTDLPPGEGERLSDLLLEMIQNETRYAVPEAGLRARAVTTGGVRPGTIVGEGIRSAMQFMAFPVSIIFTHLLRAVHGQGGMSRAAYMAHLVIGTTALGALTAQIKNVLAGKDPQPMDDGRFWAAAAAQGGGLGILGDFLFADQNRYGGGLTATLAGPLAGSVEGFGRLTLGNIQQAASGEDTNIGRELTRFARGNTPGSSLWYTRLAADRLIWEQMQEMIDPDAAGYFRRMQRRAENEFGQGFWWAPGESAPERAPDLSNAFGDGQ